MAYRTRRPLPSQEEYREQQKLYQRYDQKLNEPLSAAAHYKRVTPHKTRLNPNVWTILRVTSSAIGCIVPLVGNTIATTASDMRPILLYLFLTPISFLMYALDKQLAVNKAYRIPESFLHLIDLLGGWPGGALAQILFNHKLRKWSFQVVFWITVLIHNNVWWWLVVWPAAKIAASALWDAWYPSPPEPTRRSLWWS